MTRLAYILAASHSGSTLLTMLLNAHPDIATIGELAPGHMEHASKYLCSCGKRIRECSFWQWVTSEAKAKELEFSIKQFDTAFRMPESRIASRLLGPLHRGLALELLRDIGLRLFTRWPSRIPEIIRANEILINVIMEYYQAKVFVDKGNIALRLKYLLRIPSFDVKVIRLIRDGRGVALTYMNPAAFADAVDPSQRGGGSGGNRKDERLSMTQAAHQWRRSNEEEEHILRRLDKSQWVEARYENLCDDTGNTMNLLFEFLGLDPNKHVSDFRSVENHIVGNGMRLDATSKIQLDERWRIVLTEEDLKIFLDLAGEMNRQYGYR